MMKLHTSLLIVLAVGLVGCAEKEQAAPEPATETEVTEPAAAEAPAVDEAAGDAPDTTFATIEEWRNEALLDHMHAHAEQLDDLNFALDDGNLERAMTSAYWLARHDTIKGLPEELQPIVDRMRAAADAVQAAEDIDTARAAAQRIGAACQECHSVTGVGTQ